MERPVQGSTDGSDLSVEGVKEQEYFAFCEQPHWVYASRGRLDPRDIEGAVDDIDFGSPGHVPTNGVKARLKLFLEKLAFWR